MWGQTHKERYLRESYKKSVTNHSLFNSFNYMLINGTNSTKMNEVCALRGNQTVKEIIKASDVEFKCLKPTEEKMTVYRCIGQKPNFFSEFKLYEKRYNTKKGEIRRMPEYAYSASDKGYAEVYLPSKKGIMYEIEVPAGARVSRSGDIRNGKMSDGHECVFPRSSLFECTDNINKDGLAYIKLKYILPKEP